MAFVANGWSGTDTVAGAAVKRSSATAKTGAEKSSALALTSSVASTHEAPFAIAASMPRVPTVAENVAFVYETPVAETPNVGSGDAS